MAIKPETQFPGKIDPADAEYPFGKARNIAVPGDGTGTPFVAPLVNDTFGFYQALLVRAGLVPSGTPETALASQYADALAKIHGVTFTTIAALKAFKDAEIGDVASAYNALGALVAFTFEASDNPDELGRYAGQGGDWVVLDGERVNVEHYGLTDDSDDDNGPAVLAAAASAFASGKELFCPAGYTVKVVGDLDLTGIRKINFDSNILSPSGTVFAGKNVNGGKFDVKFRDVTDGTSAISAPPPANPLLRLSGCANSKFEVGTCNYLQLFADTGDAANRLFAYNQLILTGAIALLEITDSGAAGSYVNENTIFASRLVRYRIIRVGYSHNHNKLYNPTMEGADVEITMTGDGVSSNTVYNCRFEGAAASPGVTFGEDTYSNSVFSTWGGTGNPRSHFVNNIPVSDSGMGNIVAPESTHTFNKTSVIELGVNTQVVATDTESSAGDPRVTPANAGASNLVNRGILTPGLTGVKINNIFRLIVLSEPIPVELGDVIAWDCDYEGASARSVTFVLDENRKPILDEGADGPYISQAGVSFTASQGSYSQGTNVTSEDLSSTAAAVIRSEVKYVRLGMFFGTGADPDSLIRHIGASIYSQTIGRHKVEAAQQFSVSHVLDGTPTKGYVPLNTTVFDTTAKLTRWVSYQFETSIVGALGAGSVLVTVADEDTIANGDIVGILLDSGATHWTAVSAKVGASFTIDAIPAGESAADGSRIVFNRWDS